jgi:predicted kinase
LIACGLPGAGKTTVATRLADERRGVRLSPDDWMNALGVGLYDPDLRARVERIQWDLAKEVALAGTTAIIEWGTWQRAERDVIREWCRAHGVGVELHFLDVPLDELWKRLRVRNEQPGETVISRADLESWATTSFDAPTADELALFDAPLT